MMLPWQRVKELLKRLLEFKVGIEPMTSVALVECSNQGSTITPVELGHLIVVK